MVRRLRIDTITPVCIRSSSASGKKLRESPMASSILSTLTMSLPQKLGLIAFDPASAMLEIVRGDFDVVRVPIGGKWGVVSGWAGTCVVDVNAVAGWLLACAALIGLGGRTAIGFGRIKISESK